MKSFFLLFMVLTQVYAGERVYDVDDFGHTNGWHESSPARAPASSQGWTANAEKADMAEEWKKIQEMAKRGTIVDPARYMTWIEVGNGTNIVHTEDFRKGTITVTTNIVNAEKPSNMRDKRCPLAGTVVNYTNALTTPIPHVPATLLWTVTTNIGDGYAMAMKDERDEVSVLNWGIHWNQSWRDEALTVEHTILSSNLVAHIDWKGKPFETVLESKVFFVTNRNYRLEKQPDRKVYE